MNYQAILWIIAVVSVGLWLGAECAAKFKHRHKKNTGKDLNRCPMLECRNSGCFAYDKEASSCRYAEIGLDLDQEVTGDV